MFIPRWGTYLERIEQKPMSRIISSVAHLCNALLRVQKLFQLPVLCVKVNELWLGQALGLPVIQNNSESLNHNLTTIETELTPASILNSSLLQTLLNSLEGAAQTLPTSIRLVGDLPGPHKLKKCLVWPKTASPQEVNACCHSACLMLAKAYGELDVLQAVVLDEDFRADNENLQNDGSTSWNTLLNVLSFYNLPCLLLPRMAERQLIDQKLLNHNGLTGLFVEHHQTYRYLNNKKLVIGCALSADILRSARDSLSMKIQQLIAAGVFLFTTQGEVPVDIEPDILNYLSTIELLSKC
ncbi:hypothetical protein ACFL27_03410 [candidate division CSSED10-310 bacterium]|uniref:Uroporphyrinogen decarboxylase (URO-D) domain-containing protein n=1 Tax=candidate division CSSED10-310 bacterium TaxID=2855610 RepID=A0ABV6YSR2_UNCC1